MSKFRCIITTHNAEGKSCVATDKLVETNVYRLTDFWHTTSMPASLHDDGSSSQNKLEPPKRGTMFRFFQIPAAKELPEVEFRAFVKQAFEAMGAAHCLVDTKLDPMMHKTSTIDYIVLLKGKVNLLLEEGELALEPFDVVVQRGTNHSWVNKGNEPALLMAVLVDARQN